MGIVGQIHYMNVLGLPILLDILYLGQYITIQVKNCCFTTTDLKKYKKKTLIWHYFFDIIMHLGVAQNKSSVSASQLQVRFWARVTVCAEFGMLSLCTSDFCPGSPVSSYCPSTWQVNLNWRMRVYVCGGLRLAGVPTRVYSRLTPSVPGFHHDPDNANTAD